MNTIDGVSQTLSVAISLGAESSNTLRSHTGMLGCNCNIITLTILELNYFRR